VLKDKNSSAIVACRDPAEAKRFYTEVLGLDLAEDQGEVFMVKTGATLLAVYRSDEAGTNRANAVVWGCGSELEAIVAELKARGVAFEHYPDLPGMTVQGDLHVMGDFKAAWFKDPDGNILHIHSL
jgi:catechol 2,3-dioxygenase-like lactoylglutathione lyase family enzyme